jgi:hypothetical protein
MGMIRESWWQATARSGMPSPSKSPSAKRDADFGASVSSVVPKEVPRPRAGQTAQGLSTEGDGGQLLQSHSAAPPQPKMETRTVP